MASKDLASAVGTGLSSDDGAASIAALRASIPDADRVAALMDADRRCTEVMTSLFDKHGSNRIMVNEQEWDATTDVFASRDAARAALMPTEQDAIKLMFEAYTRLKDLGWNDPIYCPKDGSPFDVIEPGSTGIHSCVYHGEWPTGGWWIDGEDPSRPVLYRVTAAEIAKREKLRAAFRASRDSDGSGEADKTGTGLAEGDSAGLQGIAGTAPGDFRYE